MTGFYWLAAFNLAAFACISLGDLPPSKLHWRHPRIANSIFLSAVGIAGFVADIARATGATP